jgi:hypothetical protein
MAEKELCESGMVVYTCNPSYLRGGGRKFPEFIFTKLARLYLKNKMQNKRAGGMVQIVRGPGFNP